MTPKDIARLRVRTQGLATTAFQAPADVVRWLGAVQSQEFALARWSVAQRTGEASAAAVDAAIADGSILRTHVLRPTWHFVVREDLRWMLALTADRILATMRPWDRRAGLDDAAIGKGIKSVTAAIARQGHITRAGAALTLERAGLVTEPWLVGHLLMHAELRGQVCSGIPLDTEQTYALVDERAPAPALISGDEALAELARRYFRSHGPATALDYRWWSGLGAAEATRGIDLAGPALERARVGGRTYFAGHPESPRRGGAVDAVPTTHLLQSFDELIVAYSDTRDVVDVAGYGQTLDRAGLLARCIVHDGQVVARWQRRAGGQRHGISIAPLGRLTRPVRAAIDEAVARYLRFSQCPAATAW